MLKKVKRSAAFMLPLVLLASQGAYAEDADTIAPTPPGKLRIKAFTETTATLGWGSSSDNVGVTSYEVYSNGSLAATTVATATYNVTYSVYGLTPGTPYSFSVSALDAAGNRSGLSNSVELKMPGSFVPDTPVVPGVPAVPTAPVPAPVPATPPVPEAPASVIAVTYSVSERPLSAAIALGQQHTLAVATDGSVWAWGDNSSGQLGDGSAESKNKPVRVPGITVAGSVYEGSVYAGGLHSVALLPDGTVMTWGNNGFGQLGNGSAGHSSAPVRVMSGIKSVAAGITHTVALKEDGTVWSWGNNDYGQLGDGTKASRSTPARISGLENVKAIASSGMFTLALKEDGTVWAWGYNGEGQLGDGTNVSRHRPQQISGLGGIRSVAAGGAHGLAMDGEGNVWAWGNNNDGQLGDGTNASRNRPRQIPGLSEARSIAAGGAHSLAISKDGTVYAWGNNVFGQLGDGTKSNRTAPVRAAGLRSAASIAAGAFTSAAKTAEGVLYVWGDNGSGQLGNGTENGSHTPARVPGGVNSAESDESAPTAPGQLTVVGYSATTAQLGWTDSADNVGVAAYDVYMGNKLIGTSASPGYVLSELTPSTRYDITVKARDAAGNVSPAQTVTVITSAAIPNRQ